MAPRTLFSLPFPYITIGTAVHSLEASLSPALSYMSCQVAEAKVWPEDNLHRVLKAFHGIFWASSHHVHDSSLSKPGCVFV